MLVLLRIAVLLSLTASVADAEQRTGVLAEAEVRLGFGYASPTGSHDSQVGFGYGLGVALGVVVKPDVGVVACANALFAQESFSAFLGVGAVVWPREKIWVGLAVGAGTLGSFGENNHPNGSGPAVQARVGLNLKKHVAATIAMTVSFANFAEGPDHADVDLAFGLQLRL